MPTIYGIEFGVPADDDDRVMGRYSRGIILLVPMRLGESQNVWNMVVMHELGHAYGLAHVEDPGALMYYQPTSEACVHEADAKALQELLGDPVRTTCSK